MSTLVNVKDLSVSYFTYAGEVQSVRGVSFEIEKGKTTAIVGESGCGKSVTSKSLMGLIEKPGVIKEGSQILYEGKSILDFSEREWYAFRGKECSMIFQDALVSLNPTMMVGKQIMENLQNHNDENLSQAQIQKRAQEMLELVGIPDAQACMNKYPHELSGGQRQRVMIATALITNPKLLIADEPTTSLDVTIQAQILELMKQLQQKLGMAIIMITHDLGVVADMADDIIVMYAGKIVEKGTSDDIFYHPHHPYTWALMNSVPRLDLDNKKELVTIEGSIPDMIHPPKGCAFCSRCPYAMNICAEYEPETVDAQDGSDKHQVVCWLSDPRADGIVGESGCGKTTSGKTCIGMLQPTSGQVKYQGKDVHHMTKRERFDFTGKVQMIFQDPYASLDPHQKVYDIVAEGIRIHKLASSREQEEKMVLELLDMVGLNSEHAMRNVHEFSGGQRQRIGIARALAVNPEFLFCDEPISALDVSIQAQIINLLIKLQKERDLTMLFIAHDLSMVKHISDRIAVMYLGNMVELSPAADLYRRPLHPYTEALLSAVPIADPVASRQRKKIMLTGDVPSPINPPAGCRFSGRCSKCSEICRTQRPELKEVEPGHFVACHLYNNR